MSRPSEIGKSTEPTRHQNTRILHVAVPEDIFNEAKIQAIRQNLSWHRYVVGLLKKAGSSPVGSKF
jgi:hypothetical protein